MPGSPNVLDLVHRSCSEVAALHSEHVRIDDAAVSELAAELSASAEDVRSAVRGLPLPIKFSSLEQELTLLALYHLLDFGSGYDKQLQRQPGGRDARETLLYGLIGLHLGGTRLDHHKLKSFSMYDIHQVFGIDATTEVQVMPGVTMSKPGPLQPLCKLMLQALNETGSLLADSGYKTPGEMVLAVAEGLRKAGAFVEEVVDTLPAFRDTVLYDGRTLTLHRKAQNLAADLAIVYGNRDERFRFVDVDALAADSGATTIAVLRAKGVLRLSQELTDLIDSGTELPAGPHERALRAAAVTACDRIVAAAAAAAGATGAAASEAAAGARTAPAAAAPAEPPPVGEGGEGSATTGAAGEPTGAPTTTESVGESESGPGTGGGVSGVSDGGVFRAVDVGAYLAYLVEEGRELHGKVTKHITTSIMAY